LDETDGLDWKTMVRCDKIHLLPKARFDDRKGRVTEERRYLIARKIVEVLRLPLYRK
jgi:mRNA-degrading endonuclease toxin of MazEF toxin-antitoxin module